MSRTKKNTQVPDESEETRSDEEMRNLYTLMNLSPSHNAALSIGMMNGESQYGGTNIMGISSPEMLGGLIKQTDKLKDGSLERVESMLLDQAHMLQAMMTFFTSKLTVTEYLEHFETYSRLALKAQNQCRQTLATLGDLKNPKRTTFVKQQNNAVNQQINQDKLSSAETRKNSDKSANKLLEEVHHERLDFGATKETGEVNQEVETMGEINRTKIRRRKRKD